LVPLLCEYGVTGDDDFDPPVVTAFAGTASARKLQILDVSKPSFSKTGQPEATVTLPARGAFTHYFVAVSYTPFLDGYRDIDISEQKNIIGKKKMQVWTLPKPGDSAATSNRSNPRRRLYSKVVLKVTNPKTGEALPKASVLFEPDFLYGSPFTIKAKDNAEIEIKCFMTREDQNPVYVVPKGSTEGFDAVLTVTADSAPPGQPAPFTGTAAITIR
jgi:hypothetical protein